MTTRCDVEPLIGSCIRRKKITIISDIIGITGEIQVWTLLDKGITSILKKLTVTILLFT